ncbi:MAG TPA: 4a-hydroxytetrahydrobiopterin dehydratase [Acidimicrobiia bacterium]|jgi:4a-hydroxytetrahydrobiopterin dehydratase
MDDAAIASELATLDAWARDGDEITKDFVCPSFPDAIAFVVRIGFLAERANHHPDIDIRWRTLSVRLSTHDAGGLTSLDFALAREIDETAPWRS